MVDFDRSSPSRLDTKKLRSELGQRSRRSDLDTLVGDFGQEVKQALVICVSKLAGVVIEAETVVLVLTMMVEDTVDAVLRLH